MCCPAAELGGGSRTAAAAEAVRHDESSLRVGERRSTHTGPHRLSARDMVSVVHAPALLPLGEVGIFLGVTWVYWVVATWPDIISR